MKPDVMERLLMDRALGRLDPDVDALLADYLAKDASASDQSRELEAVVHLAREATRQPRVAVVPPNQIGRILWRHRAEQTLALAASFVIGMGITALVLHAPSSREANTASNTPSIQNTSVPMQHLEASVRRRANSLPFWSNQRLYLLASASAADANAKEMVK
ncbi:MAG TPA: hypothetical protein VMP11_19325 [Verrucomicrobiae bacterium]|nr:hypothetical protein [Verrucomicrobiae bacterium]